MAEKTRLLQNNTRPFRIFLRTLPSLWKSNPLLVGTMLFLGLISGIVPAITIFLAKWTTDGVLDVVQGGDANVILLAVAWSAVAIIGQFAVIANRLVQGYVSDYFGIEITQTLLNKIEALPGLDVVEDPNFYDDIEILQEGAARKPMNLVSVGLWITSSIITIIGVAASLWTIGWWVPFVVIAGMLPLTSQQMKLYQLAWSMTVRNTQESREIVYLQRVAMRHEYAKEVRLYNLIPYLSQNYLDKAIPYTKKMRKVRNEQLLGVIPLNLLFFLITSLIFVYTTIQAKNGLLTIGSIVLVVTSLSQMRDSLISASESMGVLTEHLLWYEKYYNFIDSVPLVKSGNYILDPSNQLDININNVSFAYSNGQKVLHDVSVFIPYGQTVAIVGENGAGKSTLVKLLLRFYDPTSGKIEVGKQKICLTKLDIHSWRGCFATVFQDFSKFEWTVEENITLGQVKSQEEIVKVLNSSGFINTVRNLENGVNTRIGQSFGGIDLSGGQWQKLAMARAFYRDARILILDEPTAALDPRSEAELFDKFTKLSQGRTTFLITHRLGSVIMADRILVMKLGRIVEDGTHLELLQRGGEYAELWNLQAKQYGNSSA